MKLKLLRKRPVHTRCRKLKTTDKFTIKQLINAREKRVNRSNKSKMNAMVVQSKTKNKKKHRASPRPSREVSSIAGKLLGDPQSSPEVLSVCGSVVRMSKPSDPIFFIGKPKKRRNKKSFPSLEVQSLADRKLPLRKISDPIFFMGGMKP
jgi:hypothetical protein